MRLVAAMGAIGLGVLMPSGRPGDVAVRAPESTECGARLTTVPHGDDRLRLTAVAPEPVRAGESTGSIDVRVVNVSGTRLKALTATAASVVVVEGGVVVGVPLPIRDVGVLVDLAPGESRVFASGIDLYRCSNGVGLLAGTYDVYAVQQFMLLDDRGVPQESLELQTGPWTLRLH